jgi:predicted metal-dependent phosphoesterase TrpH
MPEKLIDLPQGYLKADMHCHTFHSGLTGHMTAFEPMDCYNSPEGVYSLAKKRGMDLVTITDHDSIEGCVSFLNKYPDTTDFFIGEEVTVELPEFKTNVHVGVYDINEEQHREIQTLRKNFDETIQYLRKNKVVHALNHFFHGFPSHKHGRDFVEKMISSFNVFEGLNGAIDENPNALMQRLPEYFPGKSLIAGSDSHTLLRLGSCYTAAQASTKQEFLKQIKTGQTIIAGRYGRFHYVFNDAIGVYLNYFRDLMYERKVHIHWPVWKEIRNALGWVVCLPVFFTGALSGLLISRTIERLRQSEYEKYIAELSMSHTGGNLCLQPR